MSYETANEGEHLLAGRELKAIGGASALMALNVLVMYVFAATPLAAVNDYLFAVPIVGVLVYGAAITGGEMLAERGVEDGHMGQALAGTVVLETAFGLFGAGVLSFLPRDLRVTALGITAVIVTVMTAAIGTYVYARSISFDHYRSWATYAFIGGIVAVLAGSFLTSLLLLVGFALVFLGFLLRLGWEMWRIRERRAASASLEALGLYVAVAGVFVHVLQLVTRFLQRR